MELRIGLKRGVCLIVASAILCAAVAIVGNLDMQRKNVAVSAAVEAENPIDRFRTERQQLRSMQKAQLNDIIHDGATDTDTADLARRQMLEILEHEEAELTIEGILSMRGFKNPVATVHNGSVNILIESELITKQESSVILELVCRETGAMSSDIKIIPIN